MPSLLGKIFSKGMWRRILVAQFVGMLVKILFMRFGVAPQPEMYRVETPLLSINVLAKEFISCRFLIIAWGVSTGRSCASL